MTYINTKTPMVAKPRSDAKDYIKPLTELAYINALDALCRKEGKRGKIPESPQNRAQNLDEQRLKEVMRVLKKNSMTTTELAGETMFSIASLKYALTLGRKQGKLDYCTTTKEWMLK